MTPEQRARKNAADRARRARLKAQRDALAAANARAVYDLA